MRGTLWLWLLSIPLPFHTPALQTLTPSEQSLEWQAFSYLLWRMLHCNHIFSSGNDILLFVCHFIDPPPRQRMALPTRDRAMNKTGSVHVCVDLVAAGESHFQMVVIGAFSLNNCCSPVPIKWLWWNWCPSKEAESPALAFLNIPVLSLQWFEQVKSYGPKYKPVEVLSGI